MSDDVKMYSFTVGRDGGWSCVTPLGLVTAERKQQVMILVGETVEECARLAAWVTLSEPTKPEPK